MTNLLARVAIAQYGLHCAMSLTQDAELGYRAQYHFIECGILTHTEVFSVKPGPYAADLAASFWANHLDAISRWAVIAPSPIAA